MVVKSAEGANCKSAIVQEHAHLVGPLASALARRLPPSFDEDDLRQTGFVALLEAAEHAAGLSADHRRAYLKCRIRGAMLDSVKRGAYREATHAALPPDAMVADPAPSPEAQAAQAQIAAVVEAAQAHLSERQRTVLRYRYRDGLTQRATGEAMGGARQPTVLALERRAVAALRTAIGTPVPRPGEARRAPLRPPLAA